MRGYLYSSLAFLLVACSPPAANTSDQSGSETQAASTRAPSLAPGDQIRLGRWSKAITAMGRQLSEVECITTGDLNQLAAEPGSQCTSAHGFQRTAEGLVYEGECTGEDGRRHVRTVLNGDLQNSYTADMTVTGAGMGEGMLMHIEGTYEGACRGDES